MKSLFVLFLLSYTGGLLSQVVSMKRGKPPLDTSAFNKWPSLYYDKPGITNDGNYIYYRISNGVSDTLVIQPLSGSQRIQLSNVGDIAFSDNSRIAVCIKSNDSLCLITLNNFSIKFIPGVSSFRLFKQGNEELLSYQLNGPDKKMVLRNLKTAREQFFVGVSEHLVSQSGNSLVLKTKSKKDTGLIHSLSWVNLTGDNNSKIIWEGSNAGNLVLDDAGNQLAFVEENISNQHEKSIWYYEAHTNKVILLANNQSAGIEKNVQLDGVSNFSKDGRKLFIRLKEKALPKSKPDAVKVDVWSYTDAKLQSQQLVDLGWQREMYDAAVIHLDDTGRIYRLQNRGELISLIAKPDSDDFMLIEDTRGELDEANWSAGSQPSYYFVSTRNGERKKIKLQIEGASPDGRYLVGHEPLKWGDLSSYEVATGRIYPLFESIPIPLETSEYSLQQSKSLAAVAWMEIDASLLVYDKFDIWQVDPEGKKAPINLTNGYGRRNNIELRFANERDYLISNKKIRKSEKLYLRAFDFSSKSEGWYRLTIGAKGDPERLSMKPCNYNDLGDLWDFVKARDREVFVVRRSTASESPNFFWTKNFRSFAPITNVYPEKRYNWLTSELVSFPVPDGTTSEGIIYKPENFDPTIKYPVIIHYYEQKSEQLNSYLPLEPGNGGDINIPWFTSHGYVVFVPDIHYKRGENGQCAYNHIMAAADYLSTFPWVNAKHIGLQGHSFGGYQTNYVVTRTDRFAAAISSSGISNLVSEYNAQWGEGAPKQGYYEHRQGRMPGNLWENPDLYIRNSPVLYLDKVTTPMLMIANKRDANVHFQQGLQLFLGLRRLGKRVWMLQYDKGNHGVHGKDYVDYTIRSQQFFDHYLKGAPAPKWMTKGIPAQMKGIEDGLELDYTIKTPGPGLLIVASDTN